MPIQFATCVRGTALRFIREAYPDIEDTPESAGVLLDLVERDVVRIQDPMMHGPGIAVIPGRNWQESDEARELVIAACKVFA